MEKVEPNVKVQVWVDACENEVKEYMEEVCTSGKEDECVVYVNYNLGYSWEWLAQSLYHHHQVAALEEVRSYLPPRGEPFTMFMNAALDR